MIGKGKRMEKQHGVDITAVEVQVGWLWTWPGRGRWSGRSHDVNERYAMVYVTGVVNN